MSHPSPKFVLTKALSVVKALEAFHEVKSEACVKAVMAHLVRLFGATDNAYYSGTGRNPAPLPSALARHHLQQDPAQFYVTVKADGVRVQLVLCTINSQPRSFFVTRDSRVFEVSVTAPAAMYRNALLIDGELAWQSTESVTRLIFLGFDTGQREKVRGEISPFMARTAMVDSYLSLSPSDQDKLESLEIDEEALLELAKELANDHGVIVATRNPHGLVMRNKPHYGLGHISQLENALPKGIAFDGLIFSTDAPHGFGRTTEVLKWKSLHTVDIVLRDTLAGEPTVLAADKAGALVPLNAAVVEMDRVEYFSLSPLHNVMVEWAADQETACPTMAPVLECAMMLDGGMFMLFPLRKRPDKRLPNTVQTVLATVDNVVENITVEDLLDWAKKARLFER